MDRSLEETPTVSPPPPPEPVHSSFLRWFKAQKLLCRLAGGRAEYRDASALPAEVQGPWREIRQSFDVQLTFKKEKRRETLSCPPPPGREAAGAWLGKI